MTGSGRFRQPSVIPGFGLTFGFTIFYLAVIVLIPIFGLYVRTFELDWEAFRQILTRARADAVRTEAQVPPADVPPGLSLWLGAPGASGPA